MRTSIKHALFLCICSVILFPFSGIAKEFAPDPGLENAANLSVNISSHTALFKFTLTKSRCVSLQASLKGKRGFDLLWGPYWLEPGKYNASIPINLVANRSGTLQVFDISLSPAKTIGRRGNGELQFSHPMGIGWDSAQKEIYVADTGNDRIIRISSDGRFLGQYGGFGVAFGDTSEEREDSLDEPWDVAPGGFSNFYVSDQNNDRICEFDAYKSYRGALFPKAGDKQNRLNRPRGIITDFENNTWLIDGRGYRILKISSGGNKLFELGGFGWSSWKFKDPTQIAVDNSGRIFVCDKGAHRIGVFDRLGSFINEIKDHLKSPSGIAVDSDGLIWVCDDETSELGVYTPNGRRIYCFNEFADNDKLRAPTDLVVTPDTVYLLDSGNNRIVVYDKKILSMSFPWQVGTGMIK